MINKIIASLFFFCLVVAVFLSAFGYTRVELGGPFLAMLKSTSQELNNFKIAIPDIPKINKMEDVTGFLAVVNVLITFVNGISGLLNVIIGLLNVIISVIQFVVLLIKNFITFKDSISQTTDDFPYLEALLNLR